MAQSIDRRQFLNQQSIQGAALLASGVVLLAGAAPESKDAPKTPPKPREKKMPIPAELVQAIVRAAHKDLAEVTKLLDQNPKLANACWDWGDGDYETPLGAAAHTGQKDIAKLLLAKGARLDIFAATMLGKLDAVKAMVAAFPGIEKTPGPHGIPLIVHAQMGKEDAAEVVKFLETLNPVPVPTPKPKAD